MSDWRRRQRGLERRGSPRGSFRLEVATGGRPVDALFGALSRIEHQPGVVDVAVHHDDRCPAIGAGTIGHCTCEIVGLRIRRLELERSA